MSRSFIQIKNKDLIYTISAYENDNCKRTKKKTSEFFCYVVGNNFSFNQKIFNKIWRYTFWEFKVMEKVTRSNN